MYRSVWPLVFLKDSYCGSLLLASHWSQQQAYQIFYDHISVVLVVDNHFYLHRILSGLNGLSSLVNRRIGDTLLSSVLMLWIRASFKSFVLGLKSPLL